MYITIKHLHNRITIDDLEAFVKPKLKGHLFQKPANLQALKIIGLMNRRGKVVERHCLLRITPESAKQRVIKKLSGQSIHSKRFVVCTYTIRHWNNDRRTNTDSREEHPNNMRTNDRRRRGLKLFIMNEKSYL
jgi:hypothetical protein